MASENENVYAIILFLSRKETKNLIDLVPSSWISTDERGVVCKYPDSENYCNLPQWVALLQQPEKEWKHFDVEVISYARK